MRPEDLQPPQYGTSMHYPSCLGSCTGCLPPMEQAEAPESPFRRPDSEATAQPTPPKLPAPRGVDPAKWAAMNRAERRDYTRRTRNRP